MKTWKEIEEEFENKMCGDFKQMTEKGRSEWLKSQFKEAMVEMVGKVTRDKPDFEANSFDEKLLLVSKQGEHLGYLKHRAELLYKINKFFE